MEIETTSKEEVQRRIREHNQSIQEGQVTAILDKGASFEGQLSFEGTVRIGGNFKGEILPLVYRSLLEPNVPHYEAFTNAKFAPTDTKWTLGDLIPSQHDIKKTSSKL